MALRALIAPAIGLACLGWPAGAIAETPINDDYLDAVALNEPGMLLTRDAVTSPVAATDGASVQPDLLAPPSTGGPPEPTECRPDRAPFGRTVWWRFFPDVDGQVIVETAGYDATIALMPFTSVAEPLPQGFDCVDDRDDTLEALSRPVTGGAAYAVQVGGAADAAGSPASGTLQVTFRFLPDRDGDGVSDEDDECPVTRGTVDGCPTAIFARVSYQASRHPSGIRLHAIALRGAPPGARLDLRCTRGCRPRRLRLRGPVTSLRELAGRFFTPGIRIVLRVTKPGFVGDYIRLHVAGRGISSSHRCMRPGSTVPRRSCR